jgi:hypothetical protein
MANPTSVPLSEGTIRLWTVQSKAAWAKAQQKGYLTGDGRRVPKAWLPAYRWIKSQMAKRIPDYTGNFPVWAFTSKENLVAFDSLEGKVVIEFAIAVDQALTSDMQAWSTCILGNSYLAFSEKEYDDCHAKVLTQEQVEKSWERVLDVTTLDNSEMWSPCHLLQAVVEKITLDQITSVQIDGTCESE